MLTTFWWSLNTILPSSVWFHIILYVFNSFFFSFCRKKINLSTPPGYQSHCGLRYAVSIKMRLSTLHMKKFFCALATVYEVFSIFLDYTNTNTKLPHTPQIQKHFCFRAKEQFQYPIKVYQAKFVNITSILGWFASTQIVNKNIIFDSMIYFMLLMQKESNENTLSSI